MHEPIIDMSEVDEKPVARLRERPVAGTEIKFVTVLDMLQVRGMNIRYRAVGIWDVHTGRVAFRPSDFAFPPTVDRVTFDEQDVIDAHRDKLQIEDAL